MIIPVIGRVFVRHSDTGVHYLCYTYTSLAFPDGIANQPHQSGERMRRSWVILQSLFNVG
jgi:hypothetical protein